MRTRRLNDDDLDGFFDAQEERKPPPNRTVRDMQNRLRQSNPVRWQRMKSDERWMRKQLTKMNLNPEDWRWFL